MPELKITKEMEESIIQLAYEARKRGHEDTQLLDNYVGKNRLKFALIYLGIFNIELFIKSDANCPYQISNISDNDLAKLNKLIENYLLPEKSIISEQDTIVNLSQKVNPYLITEDLRTGQNCSRPKQPEIPPPSTQFKNMKQKLQDDSTQYVLKAMTEALNAVSWGYGSDDKTKELKNITSSLSTDQDKAIQEFIKVAAQPRGIIFRNDFADTNSLKKFFYSIDKNHEAKDIVKNAIGANDQQMENFAAFSNFIRENFNPEQSNTNNLSR